MIPTIRLGEDDAAVVERVADSLCAAGDALDDPAWVEKARAAWDDLPSEVRRGLRRFRRNPGQSGALLVRTLAIGADLPRTPTVSGSVQRETDLAAATLAMFACGLGDPGAFRAEKSGALVQNVVPVPGQEDFQSNAGSVALIMHNENAYHDHRPDYVLLLCLRADHDGVAGLRTSCVREALNLLSEETQHVLSRPEFVTQAPPSFGASRGAAGGHAVLVGDPADPDVRVDFAATSGLTPAAGKALVELENAFDAVTKTLRLVPGDLALVDNRVSVHGRTAFQPRYDGRDRWLQRVFVFSDLRRSRSYRPEDGYILAH